MLLMLLDDVGFGWSSAFGGLVDMPTRRASRAGKGAPGRAQLYFDGGLVGNAEFEYTTPLVFGIAGDAVLWCGLAFTGSSQDYDPPNAFTGTINNVTIDVSGELIEDDEATMQRLMAHQ